MCVFALTLFNSSLTTNPLDGAYLLTIFFATIGLYGVHRLVSLSRLSSNVLNERFRNIGNFKQSIILYTVISVLAVGYFAWGLHYQEKIGLLICGILSGLYVIPLFNGKRLRDIPYFKVFLIALVWSIISSYIPLSIRSTDHSLVYLLSFERFLFILAITLPFDMRDAAMDDEQGVSTFAHILGLEALKLMSYVLILIAACILLYVKSAMPIFHAYFLCLIITYALAIIAISYIRKQSSDLYYNGVLDGLMMLPLIIYYLINGLSLS